MPMSTAPSALPVSSTPPSNERNARPGDPTELPPLRELLNVPEEILDHAMAMAYQLYRSGRLAEAEVLCRGLIACDHRYWWPYSLYASVLRRLGRMAEALTYVERGLAYEPGQPKLLLLRGEITLSLDRQREAHALRGQATSTVATGATRTAACTVEGAPPALSR